MSRLLKQIAPLGLLVLAPLLWGDDTTAPSTSTLTAVAGSTTGKVNLSWFSAGDDDTAGDLTGSYRIQYATYSATWDTSSTPTNATTLTISTTTATPGVSISTTISGLTSGVTYYFGLFTGDEVPNWSAVSNTASSVAQSSVTVTEALGQPGWIGQGETQRILGISQVVADHSLGVIVSSVSVQESGGYTADSNLTNVEVWVSSSGFIDGNAIRLENTAKAFSSDAVAFTQDVSVSTTPLYFIARCDVSGSAAEGSFDVTMQVHTTAVTVNNPISFANATAVVAPPSGAPTGLNASADANLLRISLSWDASTGVDNYLIYRASHSGVATTDYLVGFSSTTSFVDDFVPPNQQVYYSLIGANRAGKSAASSADDATSAAVSALTTSNVYLRAGVHGGYGNGGAAYSESLSSPRSTFVDRSGNIFIAETNNHRIRFVPQVSGTYFGQAMAASRIYTVAGNSTSGYLADNTAATGTRINSPSGVAVDAGGNIYIADTSNHRIRFVPTSGGTYFGQVMTANYIYTIAGNGTGGYLADGVAATSTRINGPYGLSVDVDGNVYIGDRSNHRIRFVPRNGGTYFGQAMTANYIYTIAGNGTGGYVADNVAATNTQINTPTGVSVGPAGEVYIADTTNSRIRLVPKTAGSYFGQTMSANYIYTIAGNGTAGYLADNVAATSTRINVPNGVSVDAWGNVCVTDAGNYRVRIVARTSATFFGQSMTANRIYSIAGNGSAGYLADNVAGTSTRLNTAYSSSADAQGNVYISDTSNGRIRFVPNVNGTYFGIAGTAGYIYTFAGNGTAGYLADGVLATSALLYAPAGVFMDAQGNLYIADGTNNRVRFVPKTGGSYFAQTMAANCIYTIAGNGTAGYLADNVAATSTRVNAPGNVHVDSEGNVCFADYSNHRVRFVPKANGTYFGQSMTANYIYTIAGNGTGGYLADGVAATSTRINNPATARMDSDGNLYIADYLNTRIRFVPRATGTYFGQSMTADYIYTIAGNGTSGYLTDNVAATNTRISRPASVNVDAGGNVYIADYFSNHRVRFVPRTSGTYFGQSMTANYIYTIAGNGTAGYLADNVAATNTRINSPYDVSPDAGGNVYIADFANNRIRFVPKASGTYFGQTMTANYIYTIGGTGTAGYDGENAASTGKTINQPSNVFVSSEHVAYFTDLGNNKIRMIAASDFIAPSTSTLTASHGTSDGTVDLTWTSAGDDNVHLGNLTGDYRIQYATYSAAWSAGSTPANATTLTISTTNAVPGVAVSTTISGLTDGVLYYFALFTADEVPNWSDVSNTASSLPSLTLTLAEAAGQPGWIGQGETQRILGTAQVVSDSAAGVTISSVSLQSTGYTADGNLTNVEVWLSSSGYIDATAIRLESTAKAFSSNVVTFTQDVTISTTPCYLVARADVAGGATEGAFELTLQVHTTAFTVNNPVAFSNATDIVAPPSGAPSDLSATASGTLLRVSLSWAAGTGADVYTIYRATHSGVDTTDDMLGTTNTTSFVDDDIPPAQLMYYRVYGVNRAGYSGASNEASATSVDVGALTTSNVYGRAGFPVGLGDGTWATQQAISSMKGVYSDTVGHLYIVDNSSSKIKFVPRMSGTYFGQSMEAFHMYVIAGGGGSLGDGGPATSGKLVTPSGVTVDSAGNVYIADTSQNLIRFIPKTGGTYFGQAMTANYIYSIAGGGGSLGDGGAATSGKLLLPNAVSVDAAGNVFIADKSQHRIRFVPRTSGTYFGQAMTANYIYTIAGNGTGTYGGDSAAATAGQIKNITGVAVDAGGNVYIADTGNHRIRFVARTSGTYFGSARTANYIYTIGGNGTGGYGGDDGAATSANIFSPASVSLDADGNVYIADSMNNRIRMIAKMSGTYFGQSMTANYIYTIAGTGTAGYSGDGGAATSGKINSPYGVSVDDGGNVFVGETTNSLVRFVAKTTGVYFGRSRTANSIYTIAGYPGTTFDGEGGSATSGRFSGPEGASVDA